MHGDPFHRLAGLLVADDAGKMSSLLHPVEADNPPAAGIGSGSEIRAPMGVAVIGGLIVATVLSLLVVPSFYLVTDRIAARFRGRSSEGTPAASPSETSLPVP